MNGMQIFDYRNNQVRTIQKEGEAWFVLKDVCSVLGINKTADVASRLDADEVGRIDLVDSAGRKQEMTITNEPGLYSVILRSAKPEARDFKRWLTHEVLPSIRNTGTYSITSAVPRRPPEVSPGGLARLILANRRIMLEGGSRPQDVQAVTKSIYETWCIPVPEAFSRQIPGQLCLYNLQPKDETT